jgi:6-pyruvoyltetrahydropterin/6-carboxytetrahydropterin synthase
MRFTSNKVINLGSAAFRQWRSTHSHCQFIHGYNITADITFEAEELDERNWVMDFGGLKDLKKTLEHTFDHKLVVASDDPQLELIKLLDEAGVAEVIVLDGGVGCERFAQFVLKTADTFVDELTNGRVRVRSVQINEHGSNYATCHRNEKRPIEVEFVTGATDSACRGEDVKFEEALEQSDTTTTTTGNIANPANVGPAKKSNSMGNPFAGTSWG